MLGVVGGVTEGVVVGVTVGVGVTDGVGVTLGVGVIGVGVTDGVGVGEVANTWESLVTKTSAPLTIEDW